MTIWLVSREYAGIAEAGGVKNVASSLSESLVKLGHSVTLFIPLYGCTDLSHVTDFNCMWHKPVTFTVEKKVRTITFSHAFCNGVEVVFIGNRLFSEKKGVYTYTREEEKENPRHKKGEGHEDAPFLNTIFQKAVVAYGDTCHESEAPDIIHCQDATASLVPSFLLHKTQVSPQSKKFYARTKCIVTIHNAGPGYHHEFRSLEDAARYTSLPESILSEGLCGNCVEPFLLAAQNATITTVSPQYADEILTGQVQTAGLSEEFSKRGVKITGITNGISIDRYDPRDTTCSLLPASYDPARSDLWGKYESRAVFLNEYASYKPDGSSADEHVEQYGYIDIPEEPHPVYIGYHSRLVHQKGIDVLAKAMEKLLSTDLPVRFMVMGQGQPELEKELLSLALRFEGKCVFFKGYDKMLSRLVIASSDIAVFPSYFEPCGLEDFIAQIFGTIPVAHATGGLCKIKDEETGFLYKPNTPEALLGVLTSLVAICNRAGTDIFKGMISHAARYVSENYSWECVAKKYEELYRSVL